MSICAGCGGENRGLSLCPICGHHDTTSPKPPTKKQRGGHPLKLTSQVAGMRKRQDKTQLDRDAILLALKKHGQLTRDDLEVITKIGIQTITPRVIDLIDDELVVELSATRPTRTGSPAFLLELKDPSKVRELHGIAAKRAQPGLGLEEER
jgi:hypothetical protein